jgi:L-threonylcarbamoyladenylate synthase
MSLNLRYKKAIKILKNEGVGIMPTDTVYGLVGSAFSRVAINQIYRIKKRDKKKKLIILISSINDLRKFNIKINKELAKILEKFWPGKTSIIIGNIAFRLPAKKSIIEILKKTGPLVAPSANPEGLKPAENITQAKRYFGPKVDFYLSGGTLKSKPSTLIKLNNKGEIEVIRGKIKL